MVIHKKTRLTEYQRKEICDVYNKQNKRVCDLAREYHVTRPTIYKIIHRGRLKDFPVRTCNVKYNKKLTYAPRFHPLIYLWIYSYPLWIRFREFLFDSVKKIPHPQISLLQFQIPQRRTLVEFSIINTSILRLKYL